MSVQKIRTILGHLQNDSEDDVGWRELRALVLAAEAESDASQVRVLLEDARRAHERSRDWGAVARILEMEARLNAGSPVEFAMQFELARLHEDELLDEGRARAAYERLLEIRPDDPTAREALERSQSKQEKWAEVVRRYLQEAEETSDASFKSSLLMSAAEVEHRFAGTDADSRARVMQRLEQAVKVDPRNLRANALIERLSASAGDHARAAAALEELVSASVEKDDRAAALIRLARVSNRQLRDKERAARAYEQVLDAYPGFREGLEFLSEHFAETSQWEHLVALYEDQLRAIGARAADETDLVLRIAQVQWKKRGRADLAEPHFDRVRRGDPTNPSMLAYFREHCAGPNERGRLIAILTDAQRAMPDGPGKTSLLVEIASLAEAAANPQKAIEQYKTLLRQDAGSQTARQALKRLYLQTDSFNALIELLRQELDRHKPGDRSARLLVLREIADVYRSRVRSDTALVTVLAQIAALDESDTDVLRELVRVYESLGRWRDLLQQQSRLAEILTPGKEKLEILRSVARRWLEQFSNVQNATEAYEALLTIEPGDEEASSRLRELYQKRRAWGPLFSLYEREAAFRKGEARHQLLLEMAKLAAEKLDRGELSISLYRDVLAESPERADVLDLLEKQAERDKDFATVADALEARLRATADSAAKLQLLQRLGTLYADRLGDPEKAARAWQRILEISPGHPKAVRVLRDTFVAQGRFDDVEKLYASLSDWEGLADVLSTAADRATDNATKVDLSFRTARVLVNELGASERALRSYERILSVNPRDLRAARELVPIYEREERWARLPPLYELLAAHADDEAAKLALYRRLSETTGQRLNDRGAALTWAHKAYDRAPSDETLEWFEQTARGARSWETFVSAVEARRDAPSASSAEKAHLERRLAGLFATELARPGDAIVAYRAIAERGDADEEVMVALDRLLRITGQRDDLRWLFELRVSRASAEEQARILSEWAALEEDAFSDTERAIDIHRRALAKDPSSEASLRTLPRLLLSQGDASAAAEVLERYRNLAQGEVRAVRELDLADLYLDSLGLPQRAFEGAVRALELTAHHARAIALLERLMTLPETKGPAASVLEREYEDLTDPRRRARALGVLLETVTEPHGRLALFSELSRIEEQQLSAAGRALDLVLRALDEFPSELALWDRAQELSNKAARSTDLAEAYRIALRAGIPLPEEVEIELCERAAALHDERLGDPEAATPYLERILERQPGHERAFARLKQILTSHERWGELERLYSIAVRGTTDPPRRVELLHEVALVCEEITNEPAKAIGYYESIREIEPGHESAIRALEQLYENEKRYPKLAQLLELRLENASDDQELPFRIRLARIYLEELHAPERALAQLDAAVQRETRDPEATRLLERILEIGSLRIRAAEVLEAVYLDRDETRDLVRVLQVRLEAASPSERLELLRRIAALRDERLNDDARAFDTYAELVPLDPSDEQARLRIAVIARRLHAHERLTQVLTAAATQADRDDLAVDIWLDVARIYEEQLGNPERAEEVYQKALAVRPRDPAIALPPSRALERLYAAAGNHAALAGILDVQIALEDSVETRKALLARLGDLCEVALQAPARAVEAWQRRLSEDPADELALESLERLYEATGVWRDLVVTLRAREQAAVDSGARRRIMTRIAGTLADELGDEGEAILAWRAVLDEFGPEKSTLLALERLYEKTERWADLAETLEVDLSLSDDSAAKVDLLARLAEVRRHHQGDWQAAIDALRQSLALDSGHSASRASLEKLLVVPEARKAAAEMLRPLYEDERDFVPLLRVLEIEAECADLPEHRLAMLERAATVSEVSLGDSSAAFDYAQRGLRGAAGEPGIEAWLGRAERLAHATSRTREYVTLLRDIAPEILDGEVQLGVLLRVGELALSALGDVALSRDYYEKALEIRGDDARTLGALESLYESEKDYPRLLDILKRRTELETDESRRKELLFRQARLDADALGDKAAATAVYESILDIDLDKDAVAALEGLYPETGRFSDLVALHERQIEAGSPYRADLHVRIAEIQSTHLGDVRRSFDELAAALQAESGHEGAHLFLEKLLAEAPDPEQRAQAAEMLEPAYLRQAEWQKLMQALKARLVATEDPEERRRLLRRLSSLQEEQTENYADALETVAQLLHEDPRDAATWGELSRLAKVAGAEPRLAEIFASELSQIPSDDSSTAELSQRTGALFDKLGDPERALLFYRRAHAFEPESRPLFDAIEALLTREKRASDRVVLYRAAMPFRASDEEQVALLHSIAELLRDELGDDASAIETYREALDHRENDERSLEALTVLYRRQGRLTDLADLYERRAASADDADSMAGFRLQLARLLRDELHNIGASLDQYERIVHELPQHKTAIRDLEGLTHDPDHKARVIELLRPLYELADDWRHLIALNDQRLELASHRDDKIAILRETAQLWEQRGSNPGRAFTAVRACLDLDPDDPEIRAELLRLAEATSSWDSIAEALTKAAPQADPLVRRDIYQQLAKIHDQKRDDPRQALGTYDLLFRLDESDPEPLDAMDQLATLLSDWPSLVRVLESKVSLAGNDEDRGALWRRIAEIRRDMLEEPAGALTAYEEALSLEPESTFTLDSLIDLYEGTDNAERLVELYHARYALTEEQDRSARFRLLVQAALRYERDLDRPADAIEKLHEALALDPTDAGTLHNLSTLLRRQEEWPELLANLRAEVGVAGDPQQRLQLTKQIARLLEEKLGEPLAAMREYGALLVGSPGDEDGIAALMAIAAKREDLTVEASNLLEPELRRVKRFEDLVKTLRMRAAAQVDPHDRASTLRAVAAVLESPLGRPADAEQALLLALEDAPKDVSLHADLERLASSCGGYELYVAALEQRAAAIFDGEVARDLLTRAGRLADDQLHDERRAIAAFTRALEQAGEDQDILATLDRLYERAGDLPHLVEVLEREIPLEAQGEARAQLFFRKAILQIHRTGQKTEGLLSLKEALELNPRHEGARTELESISEQAGFFEEAAEILEGNYRSQGDDARLAALLERQVSFASTAEGRIRFLLDLAKIHEEQLHDDPEALSTVVRAMGEDLTDPAVLREVERLSSKTDNFAPAAAQLELSLGSHHELSSDAIRDGFVRLAAWYRDRIGDRAKSEAALLHAQKRDPESADILLAIEALQREPGRERDRVETLRARARLEHDDDRRRELFREAKTLAEGALADSALTEEILRQALRDDESNLSALEDLGRLREQAGDSSEVFGLLLKRAELTADLQQSISLQHQAARLAADKLDEQERAIELYETILERSPGDSDATASLRGLYERTGRQRDLSRLLERLIDGAESAEARTGLRIDLARLFQSMSGGASADAVSTLQAVLEEEPGNLQAVGLLSAMFEREHRSDELAALLQSQVELAAHQGDVARELSLTTRLGEVYETQLEDNGRAIETYRGALARDAQNAQALTALSRLYAHRGDVPELAQVLRTRLLQAQGESAVALAMELADVGESLHDDETSRFALERGRAADPHNAPIRSRLEKLYERQQDWTSLSLLMVAEAEVETSVGEKVRWLRSAAELNVAKRQDPGKASELLEWAAKLMPEDRELLLSLCDAYSASGRPREAIAVLDRVVASFGGKRSKDLAAIHQRLARAHLAEGDRTRALSELDHAFKIDPGSVVILRDLGELALEGGDLDRAQKTYRALLLQRLDAHSPISKAEVFYALGEISYRQGDKQKAMQMAERALENDPQLIRAQDLLRQLKS